MHAVKDILVHDVDLQVIILADLLQILLELIKGDGRRADIREHDHREHILQHALGHFDDINADFCTGGRHLAEDADAVFTKYGDDCFHIVIIGIIAFLPIFVPYYTLLFSLLMIVWN